MMKNSIKIISSVLLFISTISYAQVGIGTNNPSSSAVLELQSTNKGFIFPRLSITQRDAIAAPTMGLTIYCSDCEFIGVQSYNGNSWKSLSGFTFEGLEYGVVTSNTSKVWLDRNLGATQVATSAVDSDSYGDLYQFGRRTDGHQLRTANTATTPIVTSSIAGHEDFIYGSVNPDKKWTTYAEEQNLWQGINGINNPCPSGFRLPTKAEFEAETTEYAITDKNSAFESILKLPLSGRRNEFTGTLGTAFTLYFTSTHNISNTNQVFSFGIFTEGGVLYQSTAKTSGGAVRCIKN
jgi:hypothetical protein